MFDIGPKQLDAGRIERKENVNSFDRTLRIDKVTPQSKSDD